MFVPLKDHNPLTKIPFQYVTIGLIIANILVYFLFQTNVSERFMASYALVPDEYNAEGLFGAVLPNQHFDLAAVPERWTLISYMFLHGGVMHLGGNMLFLWIFGDNIEDALGHMRFFIFYILAGIGAALTHVYFYPDSSSPLVGASGAIAGLIGAYLVLHPKVKMHVLFMGGIPLTISAAMAIAGWFGFQVFQLVANTQEQVAWWAHIGGFVSGIILLLLLKPAGTVLFDRNLRS